MSTYVQISWHGMMLKLTLGYYLINKVGLWYHQIGHVTFSKNVFWSVNCTLPFYQIYFVETCVEV